METQHHVCGYMPLQRASAVRSARAALLIVTLHSVSSGPQCRFSHSIQSVGSSAQRLNTNFSSLQLAFGRSDDFEFIAGQAADRVGRLSQAETVHQARALGPVYNYNDDCISGQATAQILCTTVELPFRRARALLEKASLSQGRRQIGSAKRDVIALSSTTISRVLDADKSAKKYVEGDEAIQK